MTLAARRAALACLERFRERLSGMHPSAVRAVATNTFRVAKNAAKFLPQAEAALGFPIDIIAGHEEARLIYLGVAHELPPSPEPRLVVDIGGGSTEFIIGRGMTPERLESLKLGCVSVSQRFFPDGELRADAFAAAETHARAEIEAIAREFGPEHWREAYASSGTALALAAILEENGLSDGGITPRGWPDCASGWLARAAFRGCTSKASSRSACRCWQEASRSWPRPSRSSTFRASIRSAARYGWASSTIFSAAPSSATAAPSRSSASPSAITSTRRMRRASRRWPVPSTRSPRRNRTPPPRNGSNGRRSSRDRLHRIAIGFHKHGAYILENADMPGFSAQEQRQLALLVLGCRGGLSKMTELLEETDLVAQILSVRLAVLFHHARRAIDAPRITLKAGRTIRFGVAKRWLKVHPLTAHLLAVEREEWAALRHPWRSKG